jgi:hypothetical protein
VADVLSGLSHTPPRETKKKLVLFNLTHSRIILLLMKLVYVRRKLYTIFWGLHRAVNKEVVIFSFMKRFLIDFMAFYYYYYYFLLVLTL